MGSKKKKNKEQKEINRKRKRKVGSRKIEVGSEGALMKSYRKRKAEVCSAKKDGAAGDCWPADAGTEDVGNLKVLCPVKKADGRALAGQAGRKVIG